MDFSHKLDYVMDKEEILQKGMFKCEICGKGCVFSRGLKRHHGKKHKDARALPEKVSKLATSEVFHIRKVRLETWSFWWDPRPETRDLSLRWEPGPRTIKMGLNTLSMYVTRDARTGTLSMNEFMCFMRLCLFRMFLITLSYGMNTFNLLSSQSVTLFGLLQKYQP